MVQFYLLSILLNILAGLILVMLSPLSQKETASVPATVEDSDPLAEDDPFADVETAGSASSEGVQKTGGAVQMLTQVDSKLFRLVVGILSVFVGLMKLLSVYRNDVPVIGDLLPAVAGFAGGATLLIDYYLSTTSEETNLPSFVQAVLVDGRKYVGIGCLAVAVLHFLFPGVVLF
ncbi:MAG: hypothetical protein IIT68_05875 [Treponema sp.]|nr:hypothetical protein [Treponema sp.]